MISRLPRNIVFAGLLCSSLAVPAFAEAPAMITQKPEMKMTTPIPESVRHHNL